MICQKNMRGGWSGFWMGKMRFYQLLIISWWDPIKNLDPYYKTKFCLTMADKGGRGLDPPFLADIICEQPLITAVKNGNIMINRKQQKIWLKSGQWHKEQVGIITRQKVKYFDNCGACFTTVLNTWCYIYLL